MQSRNHRRITSVILTLAIVLSLSLSLMTYSGADTSTTINILHTNDMHGRFYQVDTNNAGMIGIDKLAAIKNETPNAILVDVGDAIHGLPIVNVNKGLNAIKLMTAAGYSVMSAGNHEFNYGSARLSELAGIAKEGGLSIISANTFVKATNELFLPGTSIVEIDGVKVGFFGLTPRTTPIQTNPLNVATLEFRDYVTHAGMAITSLKAGGADIIIALTHISREHVVSIANEYGNDIAVIIEGHDHRAGGLTENGVLIAGAGENMTGLGVVTIDIDSSGSVTSKTSALIPKADTDEIEGDPAVKELAEEIKDALLEEFDVVVANSSVFISSDRGTDTTYGVRNSEQPLGNLVADAMRIIGQADIALMNGGGLRADIRVGAIKRLDINAILPFGNVLVVKEATAADLKAIMEQGLRGSPGVTGWFPQVSGMNVVYDSSKPDGEKVISITINGRALNFRNTTTKYKLATNDFMAAGGDGYTAIAALDIVAEVDSLDTVLERYILDELGGTISASAAPLAGRLQDRVTRASSLTILSGLKDIDLTGFTASRFSDVPSTAWYASAVEWGADAGIVNGIGKGRFNPSALITIEELSTILDNYMKINNIQLEVIVDLSVFTDESSVNAWALDAVKRVHSYGIMNGITDNTYNPKSSVTRAEIIIVFTAFLDLISA